MYLAYNLLLFEEYFHNMWYWNSNITALPLWYRLSMTCFIHEIVFCISSFYFIDQFSTSFDWQISILCILSSFSQAMHQSMLHARRTDAVGKTKIEPFIDRLCQQFTEIYTPYPSLSIDEMVVGFKGRWKSSNTMPASHRNIIWSHSDYVIVKMVCAEH